MNSVLVSHRPVFAMGFCLVLAAAGCAASQSGKGPAPRQSEAVAETVPGGSAAEPLAESPATPSLNADPTAPESDPEPPPAAAEPSETASAADAVVLAPLPSGTRVLHIGDSFAGALGYELNKELKSHGVQGILKYEKSTYIPTWAWSKELPTYFWKYKPDLVLITLGGNELQIPDPSARAKTVQRLVSRLGDRPCVWIGIPLWEGADPALMQVIRENVAPCLYLDSAALLPDLARAGDGIHPSTAGRSRWAQTVVQWLQRRIEPGSFWKWRASAENLRRPKVQNGPE